MAAHDLLMTLLMLKITFRHSLIISCSLDMLSFARAYIYNVNENVMLHKVVYHLILSVHEYFNNVFSQHKFEYENKECPNHLYNSNTGWHACDNKECPNHLCSSNTEWHACDNKECPNHLCNNNTGWHACDNKECFNHLYSNNTGWHACANKLNW